MRLFKRVEQSLKYNEELRSSDKKLLLHEWEKDGLVLTEQQRRIFLHDCKTAESITRARRKLRSEYPGNDDVEGGRYDEFNNYRNHRGDQ